MKQLELKTYTKEEIISLTGVDAKDKKNLARNIKSTLTKWGYEFEYKTKQITILRLPTTPEERLSEILIRKFDLDIRIDAYAFGCFISRISWDEFFAAMPWGERARYLKDLDSIEVSEITLKRWAKKLFEIGLIHKNDLTKVEWITLGYRNSKVRIPAEDEPELVKRYKEARKSRINELMKEEKLSFQKAYKQAVFDEMYNSKEFGGMVLYKCSTVALSAWADDTTYAELEEIYDLCQEIAESDEAFKTEIVESCGSRLERVAIDKEYIPVFRISESESTFIF